MMKNDAENSFVETVGKNKDTEEVAIKQVEDFCNKLVKIKSLKRTTARHFEDENVSQSSKIKYKELLAKLEVSDKSGKDAYKKANDVLEKLRTN